MKLRILKALLCALLVPVVASAAHARVETNGALKTSYDSITKPTVAKNFKSSSGKSYSASASKRRYASNGKGTKRTARHYYSKKKSYASSSRGRSRHASHGGGSSRSCLQASARSLLNRIEAKFGSVNIISTCRPGAVIATSGKPSKHRNGMAIDFSASGRKSAIVQWLVANHHSGGTMTYRDMDHIHVDVGHRFVSLGAGSGRG